MQPKELNIVMTGSGKSTIGSHLAKLLSESGFNVLFNDLEIAEHELQQKLYPVNIEQVKSTLSINIFTNQLPR
jgi:shikimate kinase